MHKLFFAIFLAFFFFNVPARAEHKSGKSDRHATQLEMNYRAADSYKRTDKLMNVLYWKKIRRLKSPDNIEYLKQAQRAWIVYRDKSCKYETDEFKAGSIYSMIYFICMEDYTKRRIKVLKKYIACDEGGCPY